MAVALASVDLAFESIGSGPPVLILHGLFGSGGNWRRVARELATTHRVFTVDLRNHGSSPWADSMGYEEMAADVQGLIEREHLGPVTVVGHSMGGKVAMALALVQPELVSRLVVVDIAPVHYADRLSSFALAMQAIDTLHIASRDEITQRLSVSVRDPGVVPFLMQNLVVRNEHFDWRLNLGAILPAIPELCDFPEELRRLRYPRAAHVIAGAQSDYVVPADGSTFLPMFRQTHVTVIQAAGHWVHADQPAACITAIRKALRVTAPVAAS
jgi:esterase